MDRKRIIIKTCLILLIKQNNTCFSNKIYCLNNKLFFIRNNQINDNKQYIAYIKKLNFKEKITKYKKLFTKENNFIINFKINVFYKQKILFYAIFKFYNNFFEIDSIYKIECFQKYKNKILCDYEVWEFLIDNNIVDKETFNNIKEYKYT